MAPPSTRLDLPSATSVTTTLQALATPGRLMILGRLREVSVTVVELAQAVQMEQSAVSHQWRPLRHVGLVDEARHGRSIVYALYDDHVTTLLDEAIRASAPGHAGPTGRPLAESGLRNRLDR